MPSLPWLRRAIFSLLYHLYAKRKLRRKDATRVLGFQFEVPASVFHPQLFFSSRFLAQYLNELSLDSLNVFEMGCGSGILSIVAASRGARVVCVDINPTAVEATRRNSEINGLGHSISAHLGNLFNGIQPQQQFDLILSNPPFYKGRPTDPAAMAWQGGEDYDVIRSFIEQAPAYLKPTGIMLCVLSSDIDLELMHSLFESAELDAQPVRMKNLLFERLWIYRAQKIS